MSALENRLLNPVIQTLLTTVPFVITLVLPCIAYCSGQTVLDKEVTCAHQNSVFQNDATEKIITFAVSVENRGKKPAEGLRIIFLLPMDRPGSQHVRHVSFSPSSAPVKIDRCDGQGHMPCAIYTPERIVPFAQKILRFQITLAMDQGPAYGSIAGTEPDLSDDLFTEAHHPVIRQRALSLKKGDAYETARSIFEFVQKDIGYSGYKGGISGALKTLQSKRGDCTDHAYLFTAMCRACNIPARVMQGYVCPPGCSSLTPSNYHNWAEFLTGGAWHVSDPSRGVFDRKANDYIALGICGETGIREGLSCRRFYMEGNVSHRDIVVNWLP